MLPGRCRPDLRHRKRIQAHTVGGLIGEVIDERALWRESARNDTLCVIMPRVSAGQT